MLSHIRATRDLYRVMERGDTTSDGFAAFVHDCEPRLRRALCAAYGTTIGRDAALDALSWGWEHWDRLEAMENPVGYLYRVGQTRAHEVLRRRPLVDVDPDRHDATTPPIEPVPELPTALDALSPQQRTAAVLVHGYGLPLREVAELMSVSVASVRTHCDRALARLRTALEVCDV